MSEFWPAAVSVQGSAHARDGKACEDAFFIAADDDGSMAVVVCDGAGSVRFGRQGATAVALAVGRVLLAHAPEVIARRTRPHLVTDVARSIIDGLVDAHGGEATSSDFACTLVALLVCDGYAMTCHVGDGAIFCLEGEHPRCISPPERDPDGGSGTRFVTSKNPLPRMWSYRVPDYWTGFLCVSDGAEPALFNSVTGACSPLVSRILNRFDLGDTRHERERLLRDVVCSEIQPRSDDDITVAGVRRAYVAGIFGCPECKMPTVERRLKLDESAFFGICRACGHEAFYHNENVAETRRSYERVARALRIAVAPVRLSPARQQAS